jgi:hypothetical protein
MYGSDIFLRAKTLFAELCCLRNCWLMFPVRRFLYPHHHKIRLLIVGIGTFQRKDWMCRWGLFQTSG